jgi:predicted enzyme related to lactoylglutathione lyase
MAQPEIAGPFPDHGQFCWTEIASTDLKKATSFYSNVFGWDVNQSSSGAGGFAYLEFSSSGGSNPDGAIYEINPDWFGGNPPPAHLMIYVAVDDVDAFVAKAEKLGGSIVRPANDIPNVGRMCVIRDPTGAVFSLFTPLKS